MRLLICTVIFFVLISGCSKDKRELKDTASSLKGVWELREASGGMTPPVTFTPGNGNRLQFDGKRFQKYANGTLVVSGTYSIVREGEPQKVICMVVEIGTFEHKIVFNPESDVNDMLIEIDGDHLLGLSGCFAIDGGVRYDYVRE